MKNKRQQLKRILALDLHPASFGYAVFENIELFDWGTRRWKPDDGSRMRLGISRLMQAWEPTQVVVREGAPTRQVASVKKLAQKAGVPIITIRRSLERNAFPSCVNRFDRAAAVASRYAPLQSRVPEKRQLWDREPFQIRLFNAITAGLTYLQDRPKMDYSLTSTSPP